LSQIPQSAAATASAIGVEEMGAAVCQRTSLTTLGVASSRGWSVILWHAVNDSIRWSLKKYAIPLYLGWIVPISGSEPATSLRPIQPFLVI